MTLITNADVKKFLKLVEVGMRNGKKRSLTNYTSATTYDGTNVKKEYYVSLSFSYTVDAKDLDELFVDEDLDVSNQINDLMKGL